MKEMIKMWKDIKELCEKSEDLQDKLEDIEEDYE